MIKMPGQGSGYISVAECLPSMKENEIQAEALQTKQQHNAAHSRFPGSPLPLNYSDLHWKCSWEAHMDAGQWFSFSSPCFSVRNSPHTSLSAHTWTHSNWALFESHWTSLADKLWCFYCAELYPSVWFFKLWVQPTELNLSHTNTSQLKTSARQQPRPTTSACKGPETRSYLKSAGKFSSLPFPSWAISTKHLRS